MIFLAVSAGVSRLSSVCSKSVPFFLLDEWTAEQDPEFRRKFYEELLPDLMKAGATIVVITHDDRYLDELDLPARRIRMDEGRIVEQRSVRKH